MVINDPLKVAYKFKSLILSDLISLDTYKKILLAFGDNTHDSCEDHL